MDTNTIITPHIQTEKPALKKPPMYKVIMFNDDYTPMYFVTELLMRYFQHTEDSANTIMMHIHERGLGICGIYPKDVAESKVAQVQTHCRKDEHPLRCSFEREVGND